MGIDGATPGSPKTTGVFRLAPNRLTYLNLAAILAIVVLDWVTPAGVVVGILLTIPIVASSTQNDRRSIYLLTGVAMVGFVIAAIFGAEPLSPPGIWIPNRIFAFLTIPASCFLALMLQRDRVEVSLARDQAVSASEMNRLLLSLLAHDLRTPLTLSVAMLDYLEGAFARGEPWNHEMLGDLRARFGRSLRAIEVVLTTTRREMGSIDQPVDLETVALRDEILAEAASFEREAATSKKHIVLDLEGMGPGNYQADHLVLRQALAILIDNAIRHAQPGAIRIVGEVCNGQLDVCVEDSGPANAAAGANSATVPGAGLGLELCGAMLRQAGGLIAVEQAAGGGSRFRVRMPVRS